jgi:prolipoprotein diacylglyceryltransferase
MRVYADSLAPGLLVAQAVGRLGNYFNQELFGAKTDLPWALEVYVRTPGGVPGVIPGNDNCEFDTSWVKATPEVLCGTYHPTFLYEFLWCLAAAGLLAWADKRWQLGGGRVFALCVAGYTLGRVWIEMLRIDPANHIFGLRINVFTSTLVFLGAAVFLLVKTRPRFAFTREDPALLLGRRGTVPPASADAENDTEPPDESADTAVSDRSTGASSTAENDPTL